MMVYCIFFDISNAKRRYRVVKALDRISVRMQKSAFFSELDKKDIYAVLERTIVELIDKKTDIVSIYPVNDVGLERSVFIGLQEPVGETDFYLL